MNSISYLDSVLSRSLSTSRKGSGTSSPNKRSAMSSGYNNTCGSGGQQLGDDANPRLCLGRRASDNLLSDRAAAAARPSHAGFGFTPVNPRLAGEAGKEGSTDKNQSDASLWPQGDEDSSMESSVDDAGRSRHHEGGSGSASGFLRGKGNNKSPHKKSHSDHQERCERERVHLRRAGSTPGDFSWYSNRRVGSTSTTSSKENYGWGSLWGLTGWGDNSGCASGGGSNEASTRSSSGGKRRRKGGLHPSRTASSSSGVSVGRASVHSDVTMMSEMERENIVDFEGGEEEEDQLHVAAPPSRTSSDTHEGEKSITEKDQDGNEAERRHLPNVQDAADGDRTSSISNRSTLQEDSLPLAFATDLATSDAKAQVESGSLFSLNETRAREAQLRVLQCIPSAPPSYEAAVRGEPSEKGPHATIAGERDGPAGSGTGANRFLKSLFRSLQQAILYILMLPLRLVRRGRLGTGHKIAVGARTASPGTDILPPEPSEEPRRSHTVSRRNNGLCGESSHTGHGGEKAVPGISTGTGENQISTTPQQLVPKTQSSSRLLPNPHPVENLLGHDPNAKPPQGHVAPGTTQANLPLPKPHLTSSIIHHSPKTLVLDLDETLIHSTSRSPNWAVLRGGASVSTGGGLLGMDGLGDLLGLRSTGGRLRPHMVEVVLEGRSVLYHVYKRPWVDHFLRKVATWYNVVIFTASVQEYADPVIDWLDQGRGLITGRFFRDACTYQNGSYLKDLAIVDSDLSKVCLVDNSPASYHLNPSNGIPIEGWTHDPKDEALLDLLPVLDSLRFSSDVRHILGVRLLDS
ncbi:NIF-domain-containing protein [Tilletiaria anomala UBC 951]|uniref:NIF-domain-containing protein n=1 Tax=Tilletiaria anomala (strain ATCC 24038 / CBS 436.72 / UBC 951) TaxID=1037660 RepID=A0A066VNN5_TILAU|nr:NIF-domain-containing protein [Tilletiaria anomala UBC 951]KDN43332.1 NIF-domain-containing protein [Tilletiaria anomala UBC 951]